MPARRGVRYCCLNGTSVNTGQRLITSNIAVDDVTFPDAIDFLGAFKAACGSAPRPTNSARFPYIEPGGAYCGKECGWIRCRWRLFPRISGRTTEDLIEHTNANRPTRSARGSSCAISSDPDLGDYKIRRFRPGVFLMIVPRQNPCALPLS